ncbi:CRISPR-associated protein Cas4, partial [Saccharolobus sp.]|uniref:CRISPR-associated protein Cas4 n=1 Tax=Saccharolobus sp. TaxID=2100761 RepID=UPI003173FB2A
MIASLVYSWRETKPTSQSSNIEFGKTPLTIFDSVLQITGTQFNYYFVCKRKLWFFGKGLEQEHESDLILLGKLLHEYSYKRKLKEIQIGRIKIDFFGDKGEVHEVKRSRKIEDAHIHQLLYYLYYLKKIGAGEFIGVLHYPLLKKTSRYTLNKEMEEKIEKILNEINKILSMPKPPDPIYIRYCRRCSYSELC